MVSPLLTLVQVRVPLRSTPDGKADTGAPASAGVEAPKVWLPDTETASSVGGVAEAVGVGFGEGV